MTLASTEQRSNNNKNEEPKQEEVNQGLNEAMVGVAKELVAVLEGRTREIREEMRVHAAARRNAALAWLVEQSLAMPRRVAPEWRRYYRSHRRRRWWRNREEHACPWGWGWADNQEPSKKQLGPIDDVQRTFLSCPSINFLNIYFCFQVSSSKSDIAVIVFPLARVTFKYSQ
jgi:hypothetical protein